MSCTRYICFGFMDSWFLYHSPISRLIYWSRPFTILYLNLIYTEPSKGHAHFYSWQTFFGENYVLTNSFLTNFFFDKHFFDKLFFDKHFFDQHFFGELFFDKLFWQTLFWQTLLIERWKIAGSNHEVRTIQNGGKQ